MAQEWTKIDSGPKTLNFIMGKAVKLFKYNNKIRKDGNMDSAMLKFIGKIGVVEKVSPREQDKTGCTLVWVRIKDDDNEILIQWRVVSLRRKRQIGT